MENTSKETSADNGQIMTKMAAAGSSRGNMMKGAIAGNSDGEKKGKN